MTIPRLPPTETNAVVLYENRQVREVLLTNGITISFVANTYKEFRPVGGSKEVYVGKDADTGRMVVGPSDTIMAIWFEEDSTT